MFAVCVLAGCAARQVNTGKIAREEISDKATISGGNGESIEEAVIISGVTMQSQVLAVEYNYISAIHGEKNNAWMVRGQTIMKENGRIYDVIEVKLNADSQLRIYYFDVTAFPWKRK
jgi:tRNA A22 N-methylase